MKDNEWFTPEKYIAAAREVMGDIDLDPASCEQANRTIQAGRYYTKEQNGLILPWKGRLWCNPPYGKIHNIPGSVKSYQQMFVEKTDRLYRSGEIEQAILLLLGNCCFNRYFAPLWDYLLCIHDGFISFSRPDGSTSDFGFGTTFVYLGPNNARFTEVFSRFGRIAKAIDTPKPKPVMLDLWQTVAS